MTWSVVRLFPRSLAGHSHYHNIRHRKARVDAQRQAAFQKLSRDIYAAIKSARGERDASKNLPLARAIEAARKACMPKHRIERALISADLDGSSSDTILFEGVFPGGAAVMVRTIASRRNAVAAEMRSLISRAGGELGKATWMFSRRHTVVLSEFDKSQLDDVIMFGIDQGADDVDVSGEGVVQFSCVTMKERESLRSALARRFSHLDEHSIVSVDSVEPKTIISLSDEHAVKFGRLLSALDDHADVVDVVHNASFQESEEEV